MTSCGSVSRIVLRFSVTVLGLSALLACQRRMAGSRPPGIAASRAPADESSYAVEFASAEIPDKMKVGVGVPVQVSLRNSGTSPISNRMLAAAYTWADATTPDKPLPWDGDYLDYHTPVPHRFAPGEVQNLRLAVKPPTHPGTYVLTISLVREGVAWFSQKGMVPARRTVTVE